LESGDEVRGELKHCRLVKREEPWLLLSVKRGLGPAWGLMEEKKKGNPQMKALSDSEGTRKHAGCLARREDGLFIRGEVKRGLSIFV